MHRTNIVELLEAFSYTARLGSMSAAAEQLDATVSTISRRIEQLESILGCMLLSRNTRTCVLTAQGEIAIELGQNILDGWQQMQDQLGGNADREVEIRIAVPAGLGQDVICRIGTEYLQATPGAWINWITCSDELDFRSSAVDFWVALGPVKDDSLIVRGVASLQPRLLASPEFIRSQPRLESVDDLANWSYLALTPYWNGSIKITVDGKQHTIRPEVRMRANNIHLLMNAAIDGMGFTSLVDPIARPHIDKNELEVLLPELEIPVVPVHVVYAPDRYRSTVVKDCLNYFLEHIPRICSVSS